MKYSYFSSKIIETESFNSFEIAKWNLRTVFSKQKLDKISNSWVKFFSYLFSYKVNGQKITRAFNKDEYNNYLKNEKLQKIVKAINEVDAELLPGSNFIEKAISFMNLISNNEPEKVFGQEGEINDEQQESEEDNEEREDESDDGDSENEDGSDSNDDNDGDSDEDNEDDSEDDSEGDGKGKDAEDDSDKELEIKNDKLRHNQKSKNKGKVENIKIKTKKSKQTVAGKVSIDRDDTLKKIKGGEFNDSVAKLRTDFSANMIKEYNTIKNISEKTKELGYDLKEDSLVKYSHEPEKGKQLTNEALDILDKVSKLSKVKSIEVVMRSKHENVRNIRDGSEISKIRNKADLIRSDFYSKFAERRLKVRVKEKEPKQALILMIDDSGSMSSSNKTSWVKAIIINRVLEAEKSNSVLYLCKFLENTYDFVKVDSLDEAIRYFNKIKFGGGNTLVQSCTEKLVKYIKENNLKAEVMVINDGQDPVKDDWTPSQKTHAMMLQQENPQLRDAVKRVDGLYAVLQ